MLEDVSIHAFIEKFDLKTETGQPLSFKDHLFLFEPYRDMSPKQVILKAAQIGFSTLAILKSMWVAKTKGMDIIYTLPTDEDVEIFAGGKINRLIAQNPILQSWVKDKDRVEQKAVGDNIIYYRGTQNIKKAISHSSDLNIYDEVDSSKQDVIEQYATRLQASKHKWEWYFSHPSATGTGVDRFWKRSDQKHWFITCPSCKVEQYLSWPESIDPDRREYICKECKTVLPPSARRTGRWRAKIRRDAMGKVIPAEFSGYWIPLLICPWVTAGEILDYHKNKTEEYFYNKVLGLPYVGGGNKLTWELMAPNLTEEDIEPDRDERVVMGVDTGLKLDYVVGNERGLIHHAEATDYDELERWMDKYPRMIAIVDQGGDLIGSRKFQAKYPGRVFLCDTSGNKRGMELVKWGEKDDFGYVYADRERMIQLCVDEFSDHRIPLAGNETKWYDYWLDWNNLTRIKLFDDKTNAYKGFKWVRSGRDHKALATTYWRVGMMRFYGVGSLHFGDTPALRPNSYMVNPEGKVEAKAFFVADEYDTPASYDYLHDA